MKAVKLLCFALLTCVFTFSLVASVAAIVDSVEVGDEIVGDRPGTAYPDSEPLQVICTVDGRLGVKTVCVSEKDAGCVAIGCVAVTGAG